MKFLRLVYPLMKLGIIVSENAGVSDISFTATKVGRSDNVVNNYVLVSSDNRPWVSFTCHFLHFSVSSEVLRQSWRDLYPAQKWQLTCRTAVSNRVDNKPFKVSAATLLHPNGDCKLESDVI